MSRIRDVILQYEASARAWEYGVAIFAVGDPDGAELNVLVRRLAFIMQANDPDVWGDLFRAANALRWRRLTQVQPSQFNPALREAAEGVAAEVSRLRGSVGEEGLLDQLVQAAQQVAKNDSPVGAVLRQSIEEGGSEGCVVIATSRLAQGGLRLWLQIPGVVVSTFGELGRASASIGQAYVVGPARFFPSALVTAPPTGQVTFVAPAWFRDRSLPVSRLAEYADGALKVRAHVFEVGDTGDQASNLENGRLADDEYVPQPSWGRPPLIDREPASDEVEARKVLLGGGYAIWLDDGDRIRTLDPRQPAGERVTYTAVENVQPGTNLVLRYGATEHGAMHKAALKLAGARADSIATTQSDWKSALNARLQERGARVIASELQALGVRSAERVRAWTEPTLICPKHDHDLVLLLQWLGLPVEPAHQNAVALRRALHQASADLREELETAVGRADLAALEQDGHMRLDIDREGFRSMIVVRVLAKSPYSEIVARQRARLPFKDGGARWLE
ncbi:hypothetical protein [Kibdelosporangium aridum]|uniref:hypothetical protein n=1 Tax=Kibdelosporangium aridum TaxID=2030 RepID=UPI000526DED3